MTEQEKEPQNHISIPNERGASRWLWKNALKWGVTYAAGYAITTGIVVNSEMSHEYVLFTISLLLAPLLTSTTLASVGLIGEYIKRQQSFSS